MSETLEQMCCDKLLLILCIYEPLEKYTAYNLGRAGLNSSLALSLLHTEHNTYYLSAVPQFLHLLQ